MDFICRECGISCKSKYSLAHHIRTHMSYKDYYDKHLKISTEGICSCGKPTKFNGSNYQLTCGSKKCISNVKSMNGKENWKNENYRNDILRKTFLNEEHRKTVSKAVSSALKERWKNNSKFIKNISKATSQNMEVKWKDPIYRKNMIDFLKHDKSRHKRISVSHKQLHKNNPQLAKDISVRVTKLWEDGFYNNIFIGRWGKSGKFYSSKNNKILLYRSSFELITYKKLEIDISVKSYEVEPFHLTYKSPIDGRNHKYFPDILVTYITGNKTLIEVKPLYLLGNDVVKAKKMAALKYCEENNMSYEYWTEKELKLREYAE